MSRKTLVLLWCVLIFALPMFAQTGNQGSIEGTVTDPTGAVIAGAVLKATNVETSSAFTTVTNESGLFRFPVVPVGTYELVAEHAGFAATTAKGVRVTVGAKLNLPIALKIASETTAVDVSGELPIVETTRSQISTTVDDRSVAKLPTNGRNFIDFVLLTPGVTRDVRGGDISFAGQRGTLNSLVVDGADNNNTFFGQTVGRTGSGRAPYQFSQDAVQEFQVNSNGYSAELGRAGGAVINVITKSGTNDLHGSAFWYYRDRSMNANDPVNKLNNRAKSPYHFNQFGGTVGGPIIKNKAFFFFDYDGQRNTLPNLVVITRSLLPAAPTENQQRAIDYLTARSQSWNRTQNQDVYLGKVDWNITGKHLLSGRYNRQNFTGEGFENGGQQNSFEHTGASLVKTDTVSLALTSTLSNTIVNVARYSHQRDKEPGQANSMLPEATVRQGGQTVLVVGRNSFSPRETTINRDAWSDTVSWVLGKHTLKFGGDFVNDRILNFFPGNFSGVWNFASLESFGASLAGGAATSADTFSQAFAGPGTTGGTTHPNLFDMAGFVQDEWRVLPNLTLNGGLRYDFTKIAQPSVQNPLALAAGINTAFINEDTNNFAPRLGFAWTPLKSGRLVMRGGYGLFFARTPSIMVGTAHSNNGLNVQTLNFGGTGNPAIPATLSYPNTLCGAPVAQPNCAAPTGFAAAKPSIFFFDPNYQTPYTQQASLGVEYEVRKDLSFAVTYLTVKGNHLQRSRDINVPSALVPATITSNDGKTLSYLKYTGARPNANFNRITMFESAASSIYHGMTLQLNKRFSHKFQTSAAYTFGKAIDSMPDATAVVPFSSGDDAKMVEYPSLASRDRALSVNDQRHRFVLSGIWNLNYAGKLPAVPRAILGGWELAGIVTAQSGQPYSAVLGSDLNADGNRQTDRVPGMGRNTFTLPSTVSVDPRVTRTVALSERARMLFIWEAFNLFNRTNVIAVKQSLYTVATNNTLTLQDASKGLNAFQTPTLSSGARTMQLAVKFVF